MTLPPRPYSEQNIATYLRHRFLVCAGDSVRPGETTHYHRRMQGIVAQSIREAPNWMQVFLLDARGSLYYGARKKIGLDDGTIGLYTPNVGTIRVASGSAPHVRRGTLYHEVGHKVSDVLAARAEGIVSAEHEWSFAFWHQIAQHDLMPEGDRRALTKGLYEGAGDLIDHVNLPLYSHDKGSQWPEEGLAEMVMHYAELCRRCGDSTTALTALHRVYPELAPVFANNILPRAQSHAALRLVVRHQLQESKRLELRTILEQAPEEAATTLFRTREMRLLAKAYPKLSAKSVGQAVKTVGFDEIGHVMYEATLAHDL